jgi:hypothetical protein
MTFSQWLYVIILFSIASVGGILFTFFPGKLIRFFARLQYTMFKVIGMDDQDIDRLPFYSWFYGEDYSKALKSEIETPEKRKFLMVWARILGCVIIFFTILTIIILYLAVKYGEL